MKMADIPVAPTACSLARPPRRPAQHVPPVMRRGRLKILATAVGETGGRLRPAVIPPAGVGTP